MRWGFRVGAGAYGSFQEPRGSQVLLALSAKNLIREWTASLHHAFKSSTVPNSLNPSLRCENGSPHSGSWHTKGC